MRAVRELVRAGGWVNRAPGVEVGVPQLVVIDRFGMIRATSGGKRGDPKLEDETYLRSLIEPLLKKDSPSTSSKKATASR